MNISKKSAYNYLVTFCKLLPLIILSVGYIHGTLDLTTMNTWWSDFGFTSAITEWFGDMGFTVGVFGTAMIGYCNYIVMLHLVEVIVEVLIFIPHLFLDMLEKIKGSDY